MSADEYGRPADLWEQALSLQRARYERATLSARVPNP